LQIEAMRAKISEKLTALNIDLDPAHSEVAALAQLDGVWCRAMVDNAPGDARQPLYDFKTTTDASPERRHAGSDELRLRRSGCALSRHMESGDWRRSAVPLHLPREVRPLRGCSDRGRARLHDDGPQEDRSGPRNVGKLPQRWTIGRATPWAFTASNSPNSSTPVGLSAKASNSTTRAAPAKTCLRWRGSGNPPKPFRHAGE